MTTIAPINPSEAARAAGALEGPDFDSWAARFELLSDPNRLRILHCLHHMADLCVTDLAAAVRMSPTSVSQALRLLRQHGWVAATKDGRAVRYHLTDDTAHSLLHAMGAVHGVGHTH
ncbi:ArsR/SmtB family transcription factor [Prescottella agglutinans]|jgi:DNA-binding transcriptional ArsR family regulator|uniref:DNA-binding transcriptional ArsR family regulator n=1 Tax=Prescottella agglutinans TaxID=1644129 RepID=A0ABT6MJ70_9NOCA|nr:metalloregulator ArsR/SmtB family transcription factor [Prescottella agglutinans]MDH6284275.1 DNA-binding transcriptional ArsR family regulator [Prescottella agglutinans]